MAYNVTSSGPERIVLERAGEACTVALFVGVGALFVVVGVLLAVLVGAAGPPSFLWYLVPLFGGLAILAGVTWPRAARRIRPGVVTFDNVRGQVVIEEERGGRSAAFAYQEIRDFTVRRRRHATGRSANSSLSDTTWTYHVVLNRKSAGTLELMRHSTEAAATQAIDDLMRDLRLATPARDLPAPVCPEGVDLRRDAAGATLRWRNRLGFGPLIFLGVAGLIGGFGSLVVAEAASLMDDQPVLFVAVAGFIVVVFVLVVGAALRTMLRDLTRSYGLSLDRDGVEYFEESHDGARLATNRIPLADLTGFASAYDPYAVETPLHVIAHGASAQALNLRNLRPVEVFQLEGWLEAELRDRRRPGMA